MSLFTSNSKPNSFWPVLFSLVLVFASLEIATRFFLYPKSLDFKQFRLFPEKVQALKKRSGLGIALVGSSALAEGVDPDLLSKNLKAAIGSNQVCAFSADNSEIVTWRAMVNDLLWRTETQPDVLVVFFFGHRLSDQAVVQKGRLAQFFTEPEDWPELFRTDLTETSAQLEFALSSAWATYAARDRIKQRCLDLIIPDFRAQDQKSNTLVRTYASSTPPPATYRVLTQFLKQAQVHNTRVILVRFPSQAPQKPDPEIQTLLDAYEGTFVDMQGFASRAKPLYKDTIHLLPEGKRQFTIELAQALAPLLVHQP